MEYITKRIKKNNQVRIFTNKDSLKEYIKYKELDVLLVNTEINLFDIEKKNIHHICRLSEGTMVLEEDDPCIYKFQSAERIMNEVWSLYPFLNDMENQEPFYTNDLKIMSVFSLENGETRQLYALSLAKEYAKSKETLYVNLNIFQSISEILTKNSTKGLSEFIYYLKQNPIDLVKKMNGSITKYGALSYLHGLSFGPELYEITSEDMKKWIHELRMLTDFEIIIFDVDSFYDGSLTLFRESNSLYIVTDKYKEDSRRFHNFEEQLLWAGFREIVDKLEIVEMEEIEGQTIENWSF